MNCPKCNHPYEPGQKFCSECGNSLQAQPVLNCPNCQSRIEPGQKFCTSCGTSLQMQNPINNINNINNLNDLVTLIVTRRNSFVGMAMPIKVSINGVQLGSISVGGRLELRIPAKDCMIDFDMVGNSISMHPIRAAFPLKVSNCAKGIISVDLSVKSNSLGILTSGMFKQQGDIHADIKYM